MRVFIRADASLEIGSGHVMRCLVLADALASKGATVTFVCRAHPGHLAEAIERRGHAVVLLPVDPAPPIAAAPPHAHWLGATQTDDAAQTSAIVETRGGADLLIVDHYGLDRTFEHILRPVAGRIMVIDDLADRPHDCDLLLDQNFGAEQGERHAGLVPEHALLLLGAGHALVPPGFATAKRQRDGIIRHILVFLGGVDAGNAGLDVLTGLDAGGVARHPIAVDVLVGAANPHRAALERFSEGRSWLRLLPPQPSLAALLADYDLAIGAGGVSAIERAIAGLPSLLLAVAENQIGPARGLARAGGAIHLGIHDENTPAAVADAIRLLVRTPDLLRYMSQRAMDLCDGRGLARVVARLAPPRIDLRRATLADAEQSWHWRNHPTTRLHSGDSGEIPLARHAAWFEATLARTDRDLLMARDEKGDLGVLRFDVDADRATVSVYLDPARHGEGGGSALLEAGTRWIATRRPDVTRIEARVFAANAASRRAFRSAGYCELESLFVREIDRTISPTPVASHEIRLER